MTATPANEFLLQINISPTLIAAYTNATTTLAKNAARAALIKAIALEATRAGNDLAATFP